MFIYIRIGDVRGGGKYATRKIIEGKNEYYEITLRRNATARILRRALRRCPRGLPIAADCIRLPKKLCYRAINGSAFEVCLLINAFCELIKGQKSALICDPAGLLAAQLLRPLICVPSLYVLTARPDIYLSRGREALKTVGNSPILIKSSTEISAAVALCAGGQISAQIVLGKGGFMPAGSTVLIRDRAQSRVLSAAKFRFFSEAPERFALPQKLSFGSLSLTLRELKTMLDSECLSPYN